jgi:pimeloyl-ACP methyl ester carboxylesterase
VSWFAIVRARPASDRELVPNDELVHLNHAGDGAGGVDLCVQTFGRRTDPAFLLIGGASRSMDWWDVDFCERLATATDQRVIRYDHRDTGGSTWYRPGHPPYTFADLAADAVGILDAYDLQQAHLVGLSMGGQLAQVAAVHSPRRVASLTLIATSPEPRAPDLPPTTERLQAHFDTAVPPDWADRDAVIDYIVAQDRAYAAGWNADNWSADEQAVTRHRAAAVVDRTVSVEASHTNHYAMRGHTRWRDQLPALYIPTLVIHGTHDPLFTIEHGATLAAEMPGASLLRLPGVGHELPYRSWDTAIPAIANHITNSTNRKDDR